MTETTTWGKYFSPLANLYLVTYLASYTSRTVSRCPAGNEIKATTLGTNSQASLPSRKYIQDGLFYESN